MATTCHFWKLPRELRDEIYKLAHHEAEPIAVSGDINIRALAVTDSLLPTPDVIPRSLCAAVAVCREYFAEALPVCLRVNIFSFDTPESFCRLISSGTMLKANLTSIIVAYPTQQDTPPDLAKGVNLCAKLKDVTVCINSVDTSDITTIGLPIGGWEAMEAALDKENHAISELYTMYGLSRFHLRTEDIEESASNSSRTDYYRKFEESLRAWVTRGAKPRVCTCHKEAKWH